MSDMSKEYGAELLIKSPVQFPLFNLISLPAPIVTAPAPPENVMSPLVVSAVSDLKKLEPCTPSKVSASKPDPEPSFPACHTVLPPPA